MSRSLYRDAALADGRSDRLQVGISVLVEDGVIRWIRPADGEDEITASDELVRIDAIQAGGPADFFLVHGDPLSGPAALWRVWRVAWAT